MKTLFSTSQTPKPVSKELKEEEIKQPLVTKEDSISPPPVTTVNSGDVDCSVAHCVALTFDDGPSIYTAGLLDILKEENVKATFLILGRSAKIQRDTVRRIAKEGHETGSHSWDHKNFKKLGSEEIQTQLANTDAVISELIGKNTPFFRPPYGAYTHEMLTDSNTPFILWNIDPED